MDIMYLVNGIGIVEDMIGESALEDITKLLKQLSKNAPGISRPHLGDVMYHGDFFWAVDKDTMSVVGMVTLTRGYKPTAFFGTMEDLVVDEKYQRNGIGTELIKRLRERAKQLGMSYVNFTSSPERIAANEGYIRMGAEKRETNVYRFKL